MQQYRIEFFKNHYSATASERRLVYVHHDFINDISIDDDYLSIMTTSVDILPTTKVETGHLVRILRDNKDYFFGIVTEASPGDNFTRVSFKPFVSIFDEEIIFDVLDQYRMGENPGEGLEPTLKKYIDAYYVNNSDHLQNYPLTVTTSASTYWTKKWSMNIRGDEGSRYAVVGLYQDLIVKALKEYGVAIRFTPNFSTGTIAAVISKPSGSISIDADLDNVTIKTFKVTDRPIGVNKITVVNGETFASINYYVHPVPNSEGLRFDTDSAHNRITPVMRVIRTVTPTGEYSDDPTMDFIYTAQAVAYDELSGIQWDNLIELECMPDDTLVSPSSLRIGQEVTVYHDKVGYTSILTGRSITYQTVTLIFGSERISYLKKRNSK